MATDKPEQSTSQRILIFGNSGAGKTTLAYRLADEHRLAHLDLDTLAWQPVTPPQRQALDISGQQIATFIADNPAWVIEGCYTDLLALAAPHASEIIFLNPPLGVCIANARARPWEPHKYQSKAAQDANLEMLIGWIRDYETRDDVFSKAAHQAFFDQFPGHKSTMTSNGKE